MSKNRKEYPKLRFALITEEALKMLQPPTANEMNTPSTSLVQNQNIYEMINASVNTILERKIRNLRLDKLEQLDKLDEIIENKVSEIQDRQPGAKKSAQRVPEQISSNREISIDTVSDYGNHLHRSDSQIFNLIDARIGEAKMAHKTWDNRKAEQREQPHPVSRKSKTRQLSGGDRKKNSKGSQTNYVPPQSHPIRKASDIITKYLSQLDNRYPQRK